MKLKLLGMAMASLFIAGGGAAMADTTIVTTQASALDLNSPGGTDYYALGSRDCGDGKVVIEKSNSCKTKVKFHHPRPVAYNSQIDMPLGHIF